MPDCAPGALSKMLVKDGSGPYDWTAGNRYAYAFNRETMGSIQSLMIGEGIVGDRSPNEDLVREGNYGVSGTIEIDASPGTLLTWLPRALGGTFSGTTITLANGLSNFGVLVQKSETKAFEFRDCLVDSLLMHGVAVPADQKPKPVVVQYGIVGKDELEPEDEYEDWAFPSVALGSGLAYSPYVMSDADPGNAFPGEVTIGGTAYEIKEFWAGVYNFVHQRWVNSKTATLLCPQARATVLRVRLAFDGDSRDLHRAATGTMTGAIKLTNQSVSTRLSWANLKKPRHTPFVLGKIETDHVCQFMAFPSGATKELVVTNDSTPA